MDDLRLVPSEARAAADRKRSIAQQLDDSLNSHLEDVNGYSEFWDGLAFNRFVERYRRCDRQFRDMTRSLRSQADELDGIARMREAADLRMQSILG